MSPDLWPIEHVWDILGKRVRRRTPQPRTLGELGATLQEELGGGFLKSLFVDLLGACFVAVLLAMIIEADLHVTNDV